MIKQRTFRRCVLGEAVEVEVVPANHPDLAGEFGVAIYAPELRKILLSEEHETHAAAMSTLYHEQLELASMMLGLEMPESHICAAELVHRGFAGALPEGGAKRSAITAAESLVGDMYESDDWGDLSRRLSGLKATVDAITQMEG